MSWLKYLTFILLFFALGVLQNSLASFLNIAGAIPNLVFILFFAIIFFEGRNNYALGFQTVIIAGFFLDIFLPFYFGTSIAILLLIFLLENLAIAFVKEGFGKFSIFSFASLFLVCFILYGAFLYLFSLLFNSRLGFVFDYSMVANISYNLAVACVGFYIYRKFIKNIGAKNQLKLL